MSNSNPLASGNGTGNPSISTAWKYAVIGAVISFTSSLVFAFFFQYLGDQSSPRYSSTAFFGRPIMVSGNAELANYWHILFYVFVVIGIVCFIWELYLGSSISEKIKATNISVYEDNVKGVAIDKDFSISKLILMCMGWDKARLTNFDLAFNQITSVDLESDYAIIINASGTNYKCFVSNNSEIRTAINNKIRNG